MRFNPRPPSLAGEPVDAGRQRHTKIVSIHARHLWRANRFVSKLWSAIAFYRPLREPIDWDTDFALRSQ
jgi:hypothetical protein